MQFKKVCVTVNENTKAHTFTLYSNSTSPEVKPRVEAS
jgi:hypothetical protein